MRNVYAATQRESTMINVSERAMLIELPWAFLAEVGREMIRRFADIGPGPRRGNRGIEIVQL